MGARDSIGEVRGVVAAHMPAYQVDSVVRLGEGCDNVAYEVNGELIVRFSKEPDPALTDREARLLDAVADISPLPVPAPRFTAAQQGCLAYFKIPGLPLSDVPHPQRLAHAAPIAEALGHLLSALHTVPVDRMADLVDTDDQPLAQWRHEAAELYIGIAGELGSSQQRRFEAFLDAPPPEDRRTLAFSHNDLGIEHVLVEPVTWAVTGVIDWSDAAIADTAYDFGLLYRDLGPAAFDAAVRSYGIDITGTSFRERVVFYAKCSLIEDLAYGIETKRDKYVDNSLAAMEWLFPERT